MFFSKIWSLAGLLFSIQVSGVSYNPLPPEAVFPGPWDDYIQAPANKSHISAKAIWRIHGDVSFADSTIDLWRKHKKTQTVVLGPGGMIILDFKQNIAGRVCFQVDNVKHNPYVALTYSEWPEFATREGDATTDSLKTDIPLYFFLKNGTNCLGPDFVRVGFRFLTVRLPDRRNENEGFWHTGMAQSRESSNNWLRYFLPDQIRLFDWSTGKKIKSNAGVAISAVWVNCTAFPSSPNPRAYTGYFHSSSTLLNRIWYAGAYTLQLSTLDPKEGSALIEYNRQIDHHHSPTGSWYSNFTIANGTAVTTDGAKRDRMVWPGDMSIAVPGIAVSTYDMLAVRNALDTIFAHQYHDGSMPYAGPPMGKGREFSDTYHLHTLLGAYNYVLYSGDLNWLQDNWPAYLRALYVSIRKVDDTGLLHVTSTADWLRPGMTGHNLEASCILHDVLLKSMSLAHFIGDDRCDAMKGGLWSSTASALKTGIERLYCEREGLFADNIGRRNCGGSEEVLPQDGNSWLLLTRMIHDSRVYNVSQNLRKRWTKHGAPAPEFPNVISPFASSFELLAHCAADNHDAAVELMEMMWGYMLDGPGMTNSTFIEGYRIDGYVQYPAYWSPARNSHAHGWSTGPTMALLTEILGIKFLSPLGRTWKITPQMTKWLSHAQGGFATRLGLFEVKIKRMVDHIGRKAEVLELYTPYDSSGTLHWGGRSFASVKGGRMRTARVLDTPSDLWINLTDPKWEGMSDAEYSAQQTQDWWLATEADGNLVPDPTWMKPLQEERPVGVVHWEALERNYIVPPPPEYEGKRWGV